MSVSRNAVAKTADPDPEDEASYLLSLKIWASRRQWLNLVRQLRGPQLSSRSCVGTAGTRQGRARVLRLPQSWPGTVSPMGAPTTALTLGTRGEQGGTQGHEAWGMRTYLLPGYLKNSLRCWQQSKRCLLWLFCSGAEVGSAYRYAAEVGQAQMHVVTSWAELKQLGWALLSSSLGKRCEQQQQCLCWSCGFHQRAHGCFAVSSLASMQAVPDPQSFCGRP